MKEKDFITLNHKDAKDLQNFLWWTSVNLTGKNKEKFAADAEKYAILLCDKLSGVLS